jgi:hypothetical protein
VARIGPELGHAFFCFALQVILKLFRLRICRRMLTNRAEINTTHGAIPPTNDMKRIFPKESL